MHEYRRQVFLKMPERPPHEIITYNDTVHVVALALTMGTYKPIVVMRGLLEAVAPKYQPEQPISDKHLYGRAMIPCYLTVLLRMQFACA